MPAPPEGPTSPPSPNGRRQRVGDATSDFRPSPRRRRVLVGAAIAVAVAWAVALVYSVSRPDPEPLDPASTRLVRDACLAARDALLDLPEVAAGAPRADVAARVRAENEIFADLVATARDATPPDPEGAVALAAWLDDWDAVLAARESFAAGLRSPDPDGLRLPVGDGNAPATIRMQDYAEFHRFEECSPRSLALETVVGERRYR